MKVRLHFKILMEVAMQMIQEIYDFLNLIIYQKVKSADEIAGGVFVLRE